jgi:ketosteroid isomerase-like protein
VRGTGERASRPRPLAKEGIMRTRRLIGIVVVGLVGLAVWSAVAADKGEQEVRGLIPRIVQAWESMDIAKVDPFYAKDPNLAFFDIAPLKYASWTEYRAGVQKMFFEPNKSLKFSVKDDLRVHHRGGLAWAVFTFGADVVDKADKRSHLDGRWTMILEQRKAGWVVVHEHVSVPLGG